MKSTRSYIYVPVFTKALALVLVLGLLATPQTVFAATCGAGDGSITFYDDVGGGQCIGVITSGTTFTTPSDWSSTNKIEVVGGGGNGGSGTGGGANGKGGNGGGGGAYGVVNDTSALSAGQTYDIVVGTASNSTSLQTTLGTWLCSTNGAGGCGTVSDTNVIVGAQSGARGGDAGGASTGGPGGSAGTNKTQNGGAGDTSSGANNSPSTGGGGAAGSSGDGQPGSGQSGGDGDSATTPPGGAGATTLGAAGGDGAEWTVNSTTHGSGGGGAGQAAGGGVGGAGGLYGAGGGGGAGNGQVGGAGGAGIIVITYTPSGGGAVAPTVSTSAATGVGTISAGLNGNISNTGGATVTVRGFNFGTDSTLSSGNLSTTTETGSFGEGTFGRHVSGLLSGVMYYFRAYATNSEGTGYGGSILNFTTSTDTTATRKIRLFEGYRIILREGGRVIVR